MRNRISEHFNCPCPVKLAQKRHKRIMREIESIEMAIGSDLAEIWPPSVTDLLGGKASVKLWLAVSPQPASVGDDLREWAVAQLRDVAQQLLAAADRLGGEA